MAVSYEKKFVFIHVPKCAGTSIEKFLANLTPLSLLDPARLSDEQIKERELYRTGHVHRKEQHLSAVETRHLIGEKDYLSFYKFAFVRNPFARLASYYKFIKKIKTPYLRKTHVRLAIESPNFKEFALRMLDEPEMTLFFNQHIYICNDDLESQVDFIGKFETLDHDFNQVLVKLDLCRNLLSPILDRFGVPRAELPRLNTSSASGAPPDPKAYRKLYDDELRERITPAVAQDLRLFDYEF